MSAHAWAEKTALTNSAPHVRREASSVLALRDVAGDTGSLIPGWTQGRGRHWSLGFTPELGSLLAAFLSWASPLSKKCFMDAFIW